MTDLRVPEVLAPAGDYERLVTAVDFGADAVYVGGVGFSMRTACDNFTPRQLCDGVRYAHERGVRVYLTVNTLPSNAEIETLPVFLRQAAEAGVDALVVTDPGVLALAKQYVPEIALHASTQMGVTNYAAARALYEQGVSRVILARELTLPEIAEIREKTPPELELEAFVHGAMCVSFSGRCLLSSYLTGRDANRGRCAQPCRWKYALTEEKRPGQYFPIEETAQGTYIMNSNDLCCIEFLDQLAAAGVTSFKIEGRAKTGFYTATVTNAYYHAAQLLRRREPYVLPKWLSEEVYKVSHRRYCPGFYLGADRVGYNYESGGYEREWEEAGVVIGTTDDGLTVISQRNRFFAGEALEALPPRSMPSACAVQALYDDARAPIASAPHPTQTVYAGLGSVFPNGTLLRRRTGKDGVT